MYAMLGIYKYYECTVVGHFFIMIRMVCDFCLYAIVYTLVKIVEMYRYTKNITLYQVDIFIRPFKINCMVYVRIFCESCEKKIHNP